MGNKNYEAMIIFIVSAVFAIALVIVGMIMGAMNTFINLKESACYNSYDDKEGYAECEALEIEDLTKRITVKE